LKNQFFADKHDYFKYDLWLEVAEKVEGIKRLIFIPMLTPDTEPQAAYPPGKRRERLYRFLQSCLAAEGRSIIRLREFLCDEQREYYPYRDEDDKGFQNGSWDAYFEAIPKEWLRDAAILIDPDTGLEPNKKHSDKHVSYDNIRSVVSRCRGNWVVFIVQFTLRGNAHGRRSRLNNQFRRLQGALRRSGCGFGSGSWIAEKTKTGLPGVIALFVIGANGQTSRGLKGVLRAYRQRHNLLPRSG
jgi:hypothetical protein